MPRWYTVFLSRGVGPGCNTREIAHKLIELKAEIEDLEQRERELEQQKMWVQQSIKNVTDDVQNSQYPLSTLWLSPHCHFHFACLNGIRTLENCLLMMAALTLQYQHAVQSPECLILGKKNVISFFFRSVTVTCHLSM